MEASNKRQRLRAKNFVLPTARLRIDLDAGYSRMRCHEGLRKSVGRSRTQVLDLFAAFVEGHSLKRRDWPAGQRAVRAMPAASREVRTGPRRGRAPSCR